jgi:uncharacterized protein (TIGR02996 family)
MPAAKRTGRAATTGAEEAALLAAIRAAPDEDAPRLVYADFLGEVGDPRGELIHVECELARTDDERRRARLKRRHRELLATHGATWLSPLRALFPEPECSIELRRGLVEGIRADAPRLVKHAAKLLALAPLLSRVTATFRGEPVEGLLHSPIVDRARELHLWTTNRRLDLRAFAAARAGAELERLHVEQASLNEADLEALVASPALRRLRALDFTTCRYKRESPRLLVSLDAPLERFSMSGVEAPGALAHALLAGSAFGSLEALGLLNCSLGDDDILALVAAGRFAHVRELDLRGNLLSAEALTSVIEALPAARELLLGSSLADDEVARVIARSPKMSALARLHLGSTRIGDAGALALAASPHLGNVRSLVLSFASVEPETEAALLASPTLARARLYVGTRFLARPR